MIIDLAMLYFVIWCHATLVANLLMGLCDALGHQQYTPSVHRCTVYFTLEKNSNQIVVNVINIFE